MDSLPLDIESLEQLVSLFEEHRLVELELREKGVRVRLQASEQRKLLNEEIQTDDNFAEEEGTVITAPPSISLAPSALSPEDQGWVAITSPMTGTYYRGPSPTDAPFIEVGESIEEEQVIGLIEAMKTFSQILSEISGTVMDLPVENGEMVQPGQVLVWVKP